MTLAGIPVRTAVTQQSAAPNEAQPSPVLRRPLPRLRAVCRPTRIPRWSRVTFSHDASSDVELRERATELLKRAPLFHRMSWRLLRDLVTLEGLTVAEDGRTPLAVDFAVVVVLEGRLIVTTHYPGRDP